MMRRSAYSPDLEIRKNIAVAHYFGSGVRRYNYPASAGDVVKVGANDRASLRVIRGQNLHAV
jgi:hypothetical protein